jgi:hypothetical protein
MKTRMKYVHSMILMLAITIGLAVPGHAVVLLDDTWADGSRAEQKLPAESAWYCSKGSSLTAAANSMTLAVSTSSIMAVTYFTTNEVSPVQLKVGDTLTARFALTLSKVAAPNKSAAFRVAVCNFADSTLSPKRIAADKFSTGAHGSGVNGYALFQNMGTTFGKSAVVEIRKHTALNFKLLATSDDWTSLGTSPANADGFSGFADGTLYVLQFALQRTGTNSMAIAVTWSNTVNGATLAASGADNVATNFSFDGIAVRSAGFGETAAKIKFSELKIELTPASPPPSVAKHP